MFEINITFYDSDGYECARRTLNTDNWVEDVKRVYQEELTSPGPIPARMVIDIAL
jgi:hypothetical protein